MNIGVIGLGFVGLTLSIVAARFGNTIYGVDINDTIIDLINQGKAPFYEPRINEYLKSCINKTFFVSKSLPHNVSYDAFIITVGTPVNSDTKTAQINYIKKAVLSLKNVFTGKELVVLRSTVSVGTTRSVVIPLLESLSDKESGNVFVSFCPERTVEGNAIQELIQLPQVISGNNQEALCKARRIFTSITDNIIEADSLEEAELIKLFNNTYRDILFSIGNTFCIVSQMLGLDGQHVIHLANQDYSRSNISAPGFVGGPCLEKDAYILCDTIKESKYKDFILTARSINESLEELIINWLVTKYPSKSTRIGLSGLAFKGYPETTDLRGSNSVNISKRLHALGYCLNIHDFVADTDEMEKLNLGQVFLQNDLDKMVRECDVLLILNNHIKYKDLEIDTKQINPGFCVIDVWDNCTKLKTQKEIIQYTLGNLQLE